MSLLGPKTYKRLKTTYEIVNKLPETERITAIVLMFIPVVLSVVDDGVLWDLRPSISDYAYMCQSYWFGSLLALAGSLFIFNGAQHIKSQRFKSKLQEQQHLTKQQVSAMHNDSDNPDRLGKGYNIIFGIALFFVIYLDYKTYEMPHYAAALIFYVGCIIVMVFGARQHLKHLGKVLGILTALALIMHYLLNYILDGNNPYTLLMAEWIGLIFIGVYFIKDSLCYAPILNTKDDA